MSTASPYAELAVATNFSFLRGASRAAELVLAATLHGHHAIGIAAVSYTHLTLPTILRV